MLFSLLVGGVGLIVVYLFFYGLYYPVHRKIMLFLLIVGIWELIVFSGVEESWTGFAQILILSSAFLVYLIGAAELSLVHLFVLWGALLVVGSRNWVLIYLGLEMQTFSILILLGRARGVYGLEGGLKYFILNGVFSGCLLLGLAYLYSKSGEVYMEGQMYLGLKLEWGYVFFLVALLFKLGVAPFHLWVPDVYGGAKYDLLVILGVIPKIVILFLLLQVPIIWSLIYFCVGMSILVGAIGGLNQTKVQKLYAFSGITHIGIMLWGLVIGWSGVGGLLVYLMIYVLSSVCLFGILSGVYEGRGILVQVAGAVRGNPVLSVSLLCALFSIAGIPPLLGFLGKWLVLMGGVAEGYYYFACFVLLCSGIAGFYYLRVIKLVYFQKDKEVGLLIWGDILNGKKFPSRLAYLVGGCLYFIIFFFFFSNFLFSIAHWVAYSLF